MFAPGTRQLPFKLATILLCFAYYLLHCYNTRAVSSGKHANMDDGAGPLPSDVLLLHASNATLGFHEIYVLNLPYRSDRRDAMALAAGLSNLQVTFCHGVDGQSIQDRVLPSDSNRMLSPGTRGSWRAHINILRRVVEGKIASALVMEDDVDWDIRIGQQMVQFASASRAFTLHMPGSNTSLASVHTVPFGLSLAKETRPQHSVPLARLPRSIGPHDSPYGDSWDILWLGHCGTIFPADMADGRESRRRMDGNKVPHPSLLRVTVANDMTVPAPVYLRPHPFALPDELAETYPPHTRVVHESSETTCSLAYAVSQRGARKLLYQFGLETFTNTFDLMLRDWCDGKFVRGDVPPEDGERPECLTVQPPLFSHYLMNKEGHSDITAQGGGYLHKTGSQYIRLSVRGNLDRLVNGKGPDELWDQYPDVL